VGIVIPIPWLAIVSVVMLGALASRLAASVFRRRAPAPARAEVSRVPASSDPEVVMSALLESAKRAGDPVSASLWLEDPPTATLRLVRSVGPMGPSSAPVRLDDATLGRAATDGVATLEPMANLKSGVGDTTLWRFAVPVSADDVRGVAAVDLRSLNQPDPGVLTAITAPVRGALAGALALYLARAEAETAQALLDAARELTRRLDPDEVVRRALDRAMKLSHAATGSVMLIDEKSGHMRIAAAKGLTAEVVDSTDVSEGEGIAGWVLSTRQPLLIEDLPGRPPVRRSGVRSAVSVPIADEDGTLGVLNVGSRSFSARFTDSHMAALETLGRQVAIALRNARAMTSARDLYFGTLRALALAMETKDPYAIGATGRVADIAAAIGRAMHLELRDQQALEVASLLHDIGMGMVGDHVGATDRPLSTIELGLLKAHPVLAADVLAQVPALEAVAPIVYHHHEWFDGHGYVGGLAGESIPLAARILAVADAFVAMTSRRAYRDEMTPAQAVRELKDKAGSQFDPDVVAVFDSLLREDPALALTAGGGNER
jgi:HD-GYP domain-containing protein (c-di-GMP phosphodiesterase class II)